MLCPISRLPAGPGNRREIDLPCVDQEGVAGHCEREQSETVLPAIESGRLVSSATASRGRWVRAARAVVPVLRMLL